MTSLSDRGADCRRRHTAAVWPATRPRVASNGSGLADDVLGNPNPPVARRAPQERGGGGEGEIRAEGG